jgi:hypothetical protein
MRLNLRAVAEYMRRAETEDLLDRVTVYREEMEPAAVDLIAGELDRRGITRAEITAHDRRRRATTIFRPDGTAVRCRFCSRPAVTRGRGWHRVFGIVPLYPRLFAYCDAHANDPGRRDAPAGADDED